MKRKWILQSGVLVFALAGFLIGCKTDKKPHEPTAEETAVEVLPENIGDKNAPTAIKALKGAKEVKKRIDKQRKEDARVLQETN